jgi:hypothetical protein
MHQPRGPQSPRPDDWGIAEFLPQTVGFADPVTEIEQVSKMAGAAGAGRGGAWGVVAIVGSALLGLMAVSLLLSVVFE